MLWHWLWKDMAKPRNWYYAEIRRRTWAQFHYAFKMVKKNDSIIRSTKMAEAIAQGDNLKATFSVRCKTCLNFSQ